MKRGENGICFREKANQDNQDFDLRDKAHFLLNVYVKKQNCRNWATENPRPVHQRQLYPLKGTFYNIIVSIAVNCGAYRTMLEHLVWPAVENQPK